MQFNLDKCKVMKIGIKNTAEKYDLQQVTLGRIKEEKDLGVLVTDNLKVGSQCMKAASKGNQVLGMIQEDLYL